MSLHVSYLVIQQSRKLLILLGRNHVVDAVHERRHDLHRLLQPINEVGVGDFLVREPEYQLPSAPSSLPPDSREAAHAEQVDVLVRLIDALRGNLELVLLSKHVLSLAFRVRLRWAEHGHELGTLNGITQLLGVGEDAPANVGQHIFLGLPRAACHRRVAPGLDVEVVPCPDALAPGARVRQAKVRLVRRLVAGESHVAVDPVLMSVCAGIWRAHADIPRRQDRQLVVGLVELDLHHLNKVVPLLLRLPERRLVRLEPFARVVFRVLKVRQEVERVARDLAGWY